MNSVAQETPILTKGCLYRPQAERRNTLSKQVSFPEDDSRLVTGCMEAPNPWKYADNVDRSQIISSYSESCIRHGHRPSGAVLKQLEALEFNGDRCCLLDLKGELLDSIRGESLEEIFKRIQFITLSLENTSLDDEGAVAVFDMIEYYESANRLNISGNKNISTRGWQACSRMIKKTQCLEHLEACNMTLSEQIMPILSRSLRITTLQVLKLENCKLTGRPITILVGALKPNTSLRELYVADNDLGVTDALQLAALLRSNTCLQLLDVSNNNIQDDGAGHIVDGLIEQPLSGCGLSILVLWNNRLTHNSSSHFAKALSICRSLEMLNIGHNVLGSEVLHSMKDSLQKNRTLLRLGMQSTHLACEGAIVLAEVIEDNPIIQRIDLRDNAILVAGLMALALSMKSNKNVTQLDLDDAPKRRPPDLSLSDYRKWVTEIRSYCLRNEQIPRAEVEEEEEDVSEVSDSERPDRRIRLSSINSRKISLTCQTLLRSVAQDNCSVSGGLLAEPRRQGGRLRSPAPSPVPSPVSSPMPSPAPSPGPARNRFRVSQVSESDSMSPSPSASPSTSPTCFFPSGSSRFRVTVVEPPSPVVAANSVTLGFSCSQEQSSSSGKEPVTPDTDGEVRSILASAGSTGSEGVHVPLSSSCVTSQQQGAQYSQQNHPQPVPQSMQQQQPIEQPQPQARSRKISWVQMGISSVTSNLTDESKVPSSLERLLGLFQNPVSLFNKSPSPQPPPASQTTPRRSPQSSPQQQRAAHVQPPENGVAHVQKCSSNIPPVSSDIVPSERRPTAGNGGSSSCSLRPLAVIGHGAESISVKGGRDLLNNNEQCDVAPGIEKHGALNEEVNAAQKDENLNIHQLEELRISGDGVASCAAVLPAVEGTNSSPKAVSGLSPNSNMDGPTHATEGGPDISTTCVPMHSSKVDGSH